MSLWKLTKSPPSIWPQRTETDPHDPEPSELRDLTEAHRRCPVLRKPVAAAASNPPEHAALRFTTTATLPSQPKKMFDFS